MKFRVGACALLVCLAGCTAETPGTKFGDQRGAASAGARTAQRLPSVQAGRQSVQSVANAPDRGELISYKNKGAAVKREGAYTWYPVAISEAHALKAVVDGVMSIPSPDGSQVKVRYERHVEHPDGNWTWIGRVIGGDQMQEAILTFGEKAVYGSIPQKVGAPLSLQTRGGQLYAVQTDLSKVKNPNSRTDMMVPPALALRSALLASASKAQVSQSAVETKAATPASTVDVSIGYTAGFATAQGSQSAAVTRLVFLVDVGNQAFTNSLITGALRLVNAVQVDYTDTTTNKAALAELTGHNGTTTVPVPASLAPIRTARDQYGADLAVLVRKFQTPENDGCGIAWLNGSDQTAINPTTDDDFGFAVISDGNDSGTDGNSYFCAAETMVHELGHLMGSAHDRDNSKKTDGSLLYGRYPYSFGMKTTAANGNFYTIMAYGDNNQNFYRTFSNPLVLKCGAAGNLACGVADQTDNARSLNQTIPVVATFRAAVVPFSGGVAYTPDLISSRSFDVNGDGRSDILWGLDAGANWAYWTMNGGSKTGGAGYSVGAEWKILATGDFRGDGRLDVIWSNGVAMQFWDGSGTAFAGLVMRDYPTGYTLVGVGDINADGRDDLIWRDDAETAIGTWLMNGTAIIGSGSYRVGAGWRILGTGNLNGDNRLDLIWTDNSSMQLWAGTASGFSGFVMPTYPTGWTLVGIGDIDGDLNDDLFWRYGATGDLVTWKMSGATKVSGASYASSTAWKPLQVADYNGDGRADILWTNGTNGAAMQVWQSQGTYFSGVVTVAYPATWTLIQR